MIRRLMGQARKWAAVPLCVAAALATGGCSGGPTVSAVPAPATAPIYRLAPDDKVRINVYGEEGLTGTFQIGSDGSLSYPLVGMIKANGLTLQQLAQAITAQLKGRFVNDPRVSVDIVEYRPFYILGEVNRAGQYPYRVGLTVNAAVATAGGFTYRANHKIVAIQHVNTPQEERVRLTPGLQVLPGDTVRVLERYF